MYDTPEISIREKLVGSWLKMRNSTERTREKWARMSDGKAKQFMFRHLGWCIGQYEAYDEAIRLCNELIDNDTSEYAVVYYEDGYEHRKAFDTYEDAVHDASFWHMNHKEVYVERITRIYC